MSEATTETQANKQGTRLLVIIGLLVLAGVAIAAYLLTSQGSSETDTVARVDGTEISRKEYDRAFAQINSAYAAQGLNAADPQVAESMKQQVVATLVNRQLILNAAETDGITVSDAEVEAEYQNILESMGGAESLQAMLTNANSTEAELRADLAKDIAINKYLEKNLAVDAASISDADVEATYNAAAMENASSSEALPPLADVQELIKGQLLNVKRQEAINTELEKLRQNASVEILL